jgi:hypothetical protein
MRRQLRNEGGEFGKTPRQIVKRCVGGIAGIGIGAAPAAPGPVACGKAHTAAGDLAGEAPAKVCAVDARGKKRFEAGHEEAFRAGKEGQGRRRSRGELPGDGFLQLVDLQIGQILVDLGYHMLADLIGKRLAHLAECCGWSDDDERFELMAVERGPDGRFLVRGWVDFPARSGE